MDSAEYISVVVILYVRALSLVLAYGTTGKLHDSGCLTLISTREGTLLPLMRTCRTLGGLTHAADIVLYRTLPPAGQLEIQRQTFENRKQRWQAAGWDGRREGVHKMALSCTFPSVEGSVEESTWKDQSYVIPVFNYPRRAR